MTPAKITIILSAHDHPMLTSMPLTLLQGEAQGWLSLPPLAQVVYSAANPGGIAHDHDFRTRNNATSRRRHLLPSQLTTRSEKEPASGCS